MSENCLSPPNVWKYSEGLCDCLFDPKTNRAPLLCLSGPRAIKVKRVWIPLNSELFQHRWGRNYPWLGFSLHPHPTPTPATLKLMVKLVEWRFFSSLQSLFQEYNLIFLEPGPKEQKSSCWAPKGHFAISSKAWPLLNLLITPSQFSPFVIQSF